MNVFKMHAVMCLFCGFVKSLGANNCETHNFVSFILYLGVFRWAIAEK